jgi:hypothetical protein
MVGRNPDLNNRPQPLGRVAVASSGCNGSKYDSRSAARPSRMRKRSTAGQLTSRPPNVPTSVNSMKMIASGPAVDLHVQVWYQPEEPGEDLARRFLAIGRRHARLDQHHVVGEEIEQGVDLGRSPCAFETPDERGCCRFAVRARCRYVSGRLGRHYRPSCRSFQILGHLSPRCW